MKGIVVSVNYDDLLGVTLPRNARHLTEIVVVTTPQDKRTQAVVAAVPSARCFLTDAFTRKGERFNKGAAIEEAFDALGRDGWILIWDADILLPESVDWSSADPTKLYGAKRRMFHDARRWLPGFLDWKQLPLSSETGWPGYFQLFHGSGVHGVRPWYATHSQHAAIGDAYFHSHWPIKQKTYLPFEVLHLGPRDTNWFGRSSERLDGLPTELSDSEVDRLFAEHRWKRPEVRFR
jgi:hypothetical protein